MSSCPVTREISRFLCFILESDNNWMFFIQLLHDEGFKNYWSYEGTKYKQMLTLKATVGCENRLWCIYLVAIFRLTFLTLKFFDYLFCKMFMYLSNIFSYFRQHQHLQQIFVSDSCWWFVFWWKLNLNCSSYLHLFSEDMWLNAGN